MSKTSVGMPSNLSTLFSVVVGLKPVHDNKWDVLRAIPNMTLFIKHFLKVLCMHGKDMILA